VADSILSGTLRSTDGFSRYALNAKRVAKAETSGDKAEPDIGHAGAWR